MSLHEAIEVLHKMGQHTPEEVKEAYALVENSALDPIFRQYYARRYKAYKAGDLARYGVWTD